MTLDAHGLRVELPASWSGRVFARPGGIATLHAANFALALNDGEFGDQSTRAMRTGGTFLALTEYRPGPGLTAGAGLYAPRRIPLPIDPTSFSVHRLAHPRPGQAGSQHFFTASGRPFCLYVVIAIGNRRDGRRRSQVASLNHVLSSLRIAKRA
jgi:hypothetical protein